MTTEGNDWVYSETVKEHFLNPRNFLMGDESKFDYDAVGLVGNPICGDQMKMFIKVKDATSIVDAITYLHTHRDKLEQMSKSSRNYIHEQFSTDSYIDKLNNIYEL